MQSCKSFITLASMYSTRRSRAVSFSFSVANRARHDTSEKIQAITSKTSIFYNLTIIYLDKTWFNVCDAKCRILTDGMKESTPGNLTGKGEQLMIIGAGGEAGWVENSFLVLCTRKTGSVDYNQDMDCHNFENGLQKS